MNQEANKQKLLAYGTYSNFIKGIQHFDIMQNTYRMLTSTVLLATFAAIGFLYSLHTVFLPYERFLGVLIIGVIGISTLSTLWHLDLIFYERLLMCNFVEAYKLECKNEWLPQVHYNMIHGKTAKDRPANVVYFYIGCGASIILTTGLVLAIDVSPHGNMASMGVFILTIITILLFSFFLKTKTKKVRFLLKKLTTVNSDVPK